MVGMGAKTEHGRALKAVAAVLGDILSEAEVDRLLADRHEEIEAKLDQARAAEARGEFAPLEPLHVFLGRARERTGR
jgi:hypothetical protein